MNLASRGRDTNIQPLALSSLLKDFFSSISLSEAWDLSYGKATEYRRIKVWSMVAP